MKGISYPILLCLIVIISNALASSENIDTKAIDTEISQLRRSVKKAIGYELSYDENSIQKIEDYIDKISTSSEPEGLPEIQKRISFFITTTFIENCGGTWCIEQGNIGWKTSSGSCLFIEPFVSKRFESKKFSLAVFYEKMADIYMKTAANENQEPGTKNDLKSMMIWGDGFSFNIEEPDKWHGYTDDASQHGFNVYFVYDTFNFSTSPALIYGKVMSKSRLSVQEHLEADMENYRKSDKKVDFKNFKIANIDYEAATKKYIIDDKTCDYLCYLDPGKNIDVYLIFVLNAYMNVCDDFTKTFSELISSFRWLGVKAITNQNKTPPQ
jgi:hypothetical protein